MLIAKMAHGQLAVADGNSCPRPTRASAPTAPPAKIAASSRRSNLISGGGYREQAAVQTGDERNYANKLDNGPESEEEPPLVIATSYPFWNVFWDLLIFFAWVIFIWIAITVLIDVFRRHDISGWAKAAWVILVVILPWIGVLIYLIVEHDGMAERRAQDNQQAQAQFDDYVRKAAGSGGAAGEIEKAKQLLDSGAITQQEFETLKAKALQGSAA